jgi:flavin-dependent dehydrogenase
MELQSSSKTAKAAGEGPIDHNLVIAGGGLAGSALAVVMALNGYRVLVIERETRFRHRIRGERAIDGRCYYVVVLRLPSEWPLVEH